jgi:uncharacterized protein (DUF302 family)
MPLKTNRDGGLIHLKSGYSALDTARRLQIALKRRHLRVFARIDHSSEAAKARLRLRRTLVLLLGNPLVGTPMMAAAPTLGIDLPFKALVWEDEAGIVWLTYNSPKYLQHRHHVPKSLTSKLDPLVELLGEVVE